MTVALAMVYHDPEDQLYTQMVRVLPTLIGIFDGVAVQTSPTVPERTLVVLQAAGAFVQRGAPEDAVDVTQLGKVRRAAVELALRLDTSFIMYSDSDRALHWAEHYPEELEHVVRRIPEHDCTVMGRTQKAFDSHPRVQRDTEAIVNHVFGLVSGHPWDVTAGTRGLSRVAAEAILAGCPDEGISTDVSWPLFVQRADNFSLNYVSTEGLEFETADRYSGAITSSDSRDRWAAQLDADPRQWAHRVNLARIEIEAMLVYAMGYE